MKKLAKKTKIILVLLVGILLGCSSCSPADDNIELVNADKKKTIALIPKMTEGDYWKTVLIGADVAAKEYNANLELTAPKNEYDIEGQTELVREAVNNQVDGIIIAPNSYSGLSDSLTKAVNAKIPVVCIDSEVETIGIKTFIGTDNYEAGEAAGKELVSLAGTKCRVGLVSFVKSAGNAEKREQGFINYISQFPDIEIVAKEYCNSDIQTASRLTGKIISENKQVEAIVALNALSSIGAAAEIQRLELGGKIKMIAFDSTPDEIEFLQNGVINATVVQNPFSMGYLGVKAAVEAGDGKKIEPQIFTGTKIITEDNMFEPENQKILFPF